MNLSDSVLGYAGCRPVPEVCIPIPRLPQMYPNVLTKLPAPFAAHGWYCGHHASSRRAVRSPSGVSKAEAMNLEVRITSILGKRSVLQRPQ